MLSAEFCISQHLQFMSTEKQSPYPPLTKLQIVAHPEKSPFSQVDEAVGGDESPSCCICCLQERLQSVGERQ